MYLSPGVLYAEHQQHTPQSVHYFCLFLLCLKVKPHHTLWHVTSYGRREKQVIGSWSTNWMSCWMHVSVTVTQVPLRNITLTAGKMYKTMTRPVPASQVAPYNHNCSLCETAFSLYTCISCVCFYLHNWQCILLHHNNDFTQIYSLFWIAWELWGWFGSWFKPLDFKLSKKQAEQTLEVTALRP